MEDVQMTRINGGDTMAECNILVTLGDGNRDGWLVQM